MNLKKAKRLRGRAKKMAKEAMVPKRSYTEALVKMNRIREAWCFSNLRKNQLLDMSFLNGHLASILIKVNPETERGIYLKLKKQ